MTVAKALILYGCSDTQKIRNSGGNGYSPFTYTLDVPVSPNMTTLKRIPQALQRGNKYVDQCSFFRGKDAGVIE
jgi:hypothetical protein